MQNRSRLALTLHATARVARNFARTSDLALEFGVLAVRVKPVGDWVLV